MPDPADYVHMLALDLRAMADNAENLAKAMRAVSWQPQALADGTEIDRVDQNGTVLRAGDRVQVEGSDRYGEATGIIRGAGPDLGDGKPRVHVELEDGLNPVYTPSVGRVSIIPSL